MAGTAEELTDIDGNAPLVAPRWGPQHDGIVGASAGGAIAAHGHVGRAEVSDRGDAGLLQGQTFRQPLTRGPKEGSLQAARVVLHE